MAYPNYGKLCRPPSRASVQRPRLLRQLGALVHSKFALLCAEAGYGKTTLLLDFLGRWPHPTVWYRLDKTDRDVTQFVAYLTEGIAQHFPTFGVDIRRRLADGAVRRATPELPHLLLHEMSELTSGPLLLVLDNFEAVSPSDRVCALVSGILEYSGSLVHVAIASRTLPPLPIARLAAQQSALVLGSEDLALTLQESQELLGLHSVHITPSDVDLLWQRTEGWAAGLVMVAQALQRSPAQEVAVDLADVQNSPDLVYRYFADEVFERQSEAVQQFLVKTSILRRLTTDAVNDLLGIDNGGELLGLLRGGGVFAHAAEAGGSDLRCHHLFRTFLLRKLHARYGVEQIRQLYRRAGRSAQRGQQWSEAIYFFEAVEDWEEVARVVERTGDELTRRGFLETVRHWLNLLPEECVLRRPMLLMLRGRLSRQAGRHHEALRDLDRALRAFQETGDRSWVVQTDIEIYLVHYWLGEFQRANDMLNDALHRAGDDVVLRSRVLAELSGNCIGSDDLEQGARWGEMAAAESLSADCGPASTVSLARALRYGGRVLVLQGEFQRGLQDIERSVDLCRKGDAGDLEIAWSLFTLGHGFALQGTLDRACRLLNEAEALAHECQPLLNWIWTWRGTVHRDRGAFDEAERDYYRAGDAATRELVFLRLRQRRNSEGLHLAEEAFQHSMSGENPAERAACQIVYGIALASYDRRSALHQLTIGAETLRQRGRQQQLASVQWHLARLLLEDGRREEALDNLGDAVLWASRRGIYHLWWWDPETVAYLWPFALGAGWAPTYLLELARLRLGPDESRFLYPALNTAPPVLRSQLMETLTAVSGSPSVVHRVAADLLKTCHDPAARHHIGEALASGLIGPSELARLRTEGGLTWKEIEILTLYYLRPDGGNLDGQVRRRLADVLALSEHTVKVHIRNIRRKLNLPVRHQFASLSLDLLMQQLQ